MIKSKFQVGDLLVCKEDVATLKSGALYKYTGEEGGYALLEGKDGTVHRISKAVVNDESKIALQAPAP